MSLFELLLAITIVSSLAALGIVNLPDIRDAANAANSRDKAELIADTYNAALAAGYKGRETNVGEAIEAVASGIPVAAGSLTYWFSVEGLTSDERLVTRNYLQFRPWAKETLVFIRSNGAL